MQPKYLTPFRREQTTLKDRTVFIIEDEEYIRDNLSEILAMHGYRVTAFSDGESGTDAVKKAACDIMLTDLQLPGMSGIDVIRNVKEVSPDTACVILTGYATVETAVEAMRAGAFTYIKKPFSKDELLIILEKAYEVCVLKEENTKLKNEIKKSYTDAILGSSPEIEGVRAIIRKVADTDTTALILGESGTGKELVARALHYGSSRANKPFVPINCGAIPEDLLESELFGHEKGAFTGAIATKIGRFEAAHQGTVFLDEIGDMSPGLQVKILRVLQEKEFERVGGRSTIKVDVRVVAATNQDLDRAVEEKRFREDLFYRLNVIPITLPPLRRRNEDIAILVNEFLDKVSGRKSKTIKGVAPEAMVLLEGYDWPGNIRELENLIERIVVLKDNNSIIAPVDLPEKIRKRQVRTDLSEISLPPEGLDFNMAVNNFEKDLIVNALSMVNGVKKKAAEYLRLNRTTLIEKMKRMGLLEKVESSESGDSYSNSEGRGKERTNRV
jgi:DNA-binding NtrC family response regulator